jgi:hypothetical protein
MNLTGILELFVGAKSKQRERSIAHHPSLKLSSLFPSFKWLQFARNGTLGDGQKIEGWGEGNFGENNTNLAIYFWH